MTLPFLCPYWWQKWYKMCHMDNLHCPNCDYLIGRLEVVEPPKNADANHVKAWVGVTTWEGWEAPADLYGRYRLWAEASGRDTLSQRRFSAAALAAGATWRKTNKGRLYAMHF